MLIIEDHVQVIFAFYRPPGAGANAGGYLGKIAEGGYFHDLDFERLRKLGTGHHEAPMDERAPSFLGAVPAMSQRETLDLELCWVLFQWSVGALSRGELWMQICDLADRRRSLKA